MASNIKRFTRGLNAALNDTIIPTRRVLLRTAAIGIVVIALPGWLVLGRVRVIPFMAFSYYATVSFLDNSYSLRKLLIMSAGALATVALIPIIMFFRYGLFSSPHDYEISPIVDVALNWGSLVVAIIGAAAFIVAALASTVVRICQIGDAIETEDAFKNIATLTSSQKLWMNRIIALGWMAAAAVLLFFLIEPK